MLEALQKELNKKGLLTEQHVLEVFEDVVRHDNARFTHGWRTKKWGALEEVRTNRIKLKKWLRNQTFGNG